jgi:hydrogenase expression/formation protein HypE
MTIEEPREKRAESERLPPLGKIHPHFFDRFIAPRLGAPSSNVVVGPRNGVDVGIVDVGDGKVMAVTADPFFVVPQYGWKRAGWFAVHILASDLATCGLPPAYMSIDLNLPREMSEDDLAELWQAVHQTCSDLGITVVTGHTGRYEGCGFPMVGGCTMIAIGAQDAYVVCGMSRPDDAVLVTKGAAIEASGLFAVTFPEQLSQAYGGRFAEEAQQLFWQMSTVEDAMVAARVGVRDAGVTAMHDATECGVFGGLYEMARAAGLGMVIDVPSIPVRDDVARICQHYAMDPYTAISEGTLLMTCRPHAVDALLEAYAGAGIIAARIGSCTAGNEVVLEGPDGRRTLEHPRVDPFWEAFERASRA